MDQTPRRTAKACVICHKKKIKCDLIPGSGSPCSACVRDGYECRARERKRKRIYTLDDESPPPQARKSQVIYPPNGTTAPLASFGTSPESVESPIQARNPVPVAQHLGKDQSNVDPALPTNLAENGENKPVPLSAVTIRRPSYGQSSVSYLGRSEYIGDGVPINDEEEAPPHSTRGLSGKDMEILQVQRVFELPSRGIRETLIQSYWTRCWPWTPIVERTWLEGRPQNEVSILLLQSVMLAGSRVSSSPIDPGCLYDKAKMLFWMGVERDPMIMTVAALLLNWWNPESPEHYSIDTSGFWVRIAVGLAYQLGLHRDPVDKPDSSLRKRLWWSLAVRDSLINAGHGRPRAISHAVTDVPLPSVDDFDGNIQATDMFCAYVGISMILGDLTQYFLEKGRLSSQRQSLSDRTFRWMRTLPDSLQLFNSKTQSDKSLRPYSFEARQLHVQYFTVLTILNRSTQPSSSPSTASLLAASFIAGIFKDFLDRDELQFLGPIFTFYLLTAGVTLLSSYRFAGLWHLAEQDLDIIFTAQEELGKRWASAHGSLWRIRTSKAKVLKCQRSSYFPENNLTREQMEFFELFGPELCRSWNVLYPDSKTQQAATKDLMTAGILTDLYTDAAQDGLEAGNLANTSLDSQMMDGETDIQWSADPYSGGLGNWLFSDWQEASHWG